MGGSKRLLVTSYILHFPETFSTMNFWCKFVLNFLLSSQNLMTSFISDIAYSIIVLLSIIDWFFPRIYQYYSKNQFLTIYPVFFFILASVTPLLLACLFLMYYCLCLLCGLYYTGACYCTFFYHFRYIKCFWTVLCVGYCFWQCIT